MDFILKILVGFTGWKQVWLWFWFLFGASVYMYKRGWYLIHGPNPVANTWREFFHVASAPLFFRFFVESLIFWAFFNPQLVIGLLDYFGWTSFSGTIRVITQFAPCSAAFGLTVDVLVDWAIGTVVSKIPLFQGWWPQMPSPLPKSQVANPPTPAQRLKEGG
jgi:hypothetical protein